MDELTIRRGRGATMVRQQQPAGRAEKPSESSQTQRTAGTAGFTVSETLQRLMSRVSQAEFLSRESRQTLQMGESVLAEVQDRLGRIAELVQEAAGGGEPDRDALQAELEQLREGMDKMLRGAVSGGMRLFLDEDGVLEDGLEALLYAVMNKSAAGEEAAQDLPDWLLKGIIQNSLTPEQLLAGLGLDKSASGAQLLAAIRGSSLETNPAAACLAALYLGAVISGSADGVERALDGLQQLLEKVLDGMPPDQALETLTDGAFTSFEDFEAQFTGGTAPGLQSFLEELLLADGGGLLLDGSSLLTLLAGMEGMDLELLMGLLNALQGTGGPPLEAGANLEAAVPGGTAAPETPGEQAAAPDGAEAAGKGAQPGPAAAGTAAAREAEGAAPLSVLRFGQLQVMGRDLSGVSWNAAAGALTLSGGADVTILGGDGETILLTGSGTVTFQGTSSAAVIVDAPEARIFSAGENTLSGLELREGSALTLDGSGPLKLGGLQAGRTNTLRLAGGAVILPESSGKEGLPFPILLDGPASLAAQAGNVRSFSGKPLEPFDLIWKTLLPGWSSISAIEVDGRQAKLTLLNGTVPDPARLWLEKGDSQGYHIHHLIVWGRDESGRPRVRYAYLRWDRHSGTFRETGMYPNPFAITGGEQNQDWVYEEESHTLRILSNQVTAISGGPGTDANQVPFSGRIALADGIGKLELTLGGVVCRVASGKAFCLGRENDVTLMLERGTRNLFKSGAGYAGISLGEGTCLSIDCAGERTGAGLLTATGGADGAGIGRDSGGSQDQTSHILIRDGVITATGTGGGAGIGAGKRGGMGPITLLGGMITATGGKGGGAGIGGALGAPVGDISIHGGIVTAVASYHAAAIGAGVQGKSGDILITGTARIVKALGGNPGADIGACLFGGCGKVLISGGADIGNARLWTQPGIALQMGADTVTLPQFRLSSRALGLDRLSVATREYAKAAQMTVDADQRWVSRIQAAYRGLYGRIEQNLSGLGSVQQYIGLVRDTAAADTLLDDMRRSILLQSAQALRTHRRNTRDTEELKQLLT